MPFLPSYVPDGTPVYSLGPQGGGLATFLYDDRNINYAAAAQRDSLAASVSLPPGPGDGEFGDPPPPPPPDTTPNINKFMAQTFQLLDTNLVALTDTNLYNILLAFPADTNTGPSLQIARRATNAVVVKANRFDYSAETTRNFALLVCDKPETPVWKNIDLLASSDTQDGWLIQGSVQPYKVTNPMFMLVSNINLDYSAFFRATPYGGPEILLSAAQNYSTVSNTITLTANISDLTGTRVTNHQFAVKVNGLPARWAHTSTNGITLDTRYAPAGIQEVEVTMGSVPVVFDPQDPPISTTLWDANSQQLEWDATATLPLDFENPAFLVNASDMCSPDMGTNYITFGINQAGQISATISEPSSGRLLATYSGYVPYAATLSLE
jgi:hypothetical protein